MLTVAYHRLCAIGALPASPHCTAACGGHLQWRLLLLGAKYTGAVERRNATNTPTATCCRCALPCNRRRLCSLSGWRCGARNRRRICWRRSCRGGRCNFGSCSAADGLHHRQSSTPRRVGTAHKRALVRASVGVAAFHRVCAVIGIAFVQQNGDPIVIRCFLHLCTEGQIGSDELLVVLGLRGRGTRC